MVLKIVKHKDEDIYEVFSDEDGHIGKIAQGNKKGYLCWQFFQVSKEYGIFGLSAGWINQIGKLLKDLGKKNQE